MGAKLGFYIGWQRDEDFDIQTNRTYVGIGLLRYMVPPIAIPTEKRHEYQQRMNITIYLCDSPGEKDEEALRRPIVIRRIKEEYIINVFEEEYPGGLEEWAKSVEEQLGGYYTSQAKGQVAGLVPCECPQYDGKSYKIEVIERRYIPPITEELPKWEKERIEYIQSLIKAAESPDEILMYQDEINKILKRYGRK